MPEVQNVGAVDYAQYQPSQYVEDNYANDYNTQPEVYDEHYAQMQAANKSRLGATILSAAVVGGLAYLGGHYMGKRGSKAEIEKAMEAISKYEKRVAELEKKAAELEKEADTVTNSNFGGFRFGKDFAKKFKEFFNKFFKKAEDTKDKVNDAADKTAKDTKKAAEDASKKS